MADIFDTVYVARAGSDGNPGTRDKPVRSIKRANAVVAENENVTRILVGKGHYRETVVPPRSGLLYEGRGAVIVIEPPNARGFHIEHSDVEIEGFRILTK